MNKSIKIKKRINHDSMWFSCLFPSGGNFRYTITRYSKKLELAFSNDDTELQIQSQIFQDWIDTQDMSYGDLFNKLEDLCASCNTGQELINKIS